MYGLSALCPRSGSRQKARPGTRLQITLFPPPLSQAKTELKKPALQRDSLGWRRTTQLSSMLAQLFLPSSPSSQGHDIQTQAEGCSRVMFFIYWKCFANPAALPSGQLLSLPASKTACAKNRESIKGNRKYLQTE